MPRDPGTRIDPVLAHILTLLFTLVAMCSEVAAMRAIPDDNLAYPVLITLKGDKQGSGFFLNTQGGSFLVTAQHVLFKEKTDELLAPEAEALSYAKDPSDKGRNVFEIDLAVLKRAGNIKRHATHDVAVVRIGTRVKDGGAQALDVVAGVKIKEIAASGILGVGESTVKRFADVLTANQIFIFGFPTSIGLKAIPQINYLRPLLRAGIVAGVNEQAKTIILDCPAYGGNSGGPVLEVEEEGFQRKYRVIGVVSQFVPVAETWFNMTHRYTNTNISNSGYAIAIPMDFVLELISQF